MVAAWAAARRSTQSLLEELLRAGSPLGPRLAAVWQAQYTEPPGGAAARVVAAWAAARRSTQSLLEELLRAGSPLGLRLAFVWQGQYTEPSGGAAARLVAAQTAAGCLVALHLVTSTFILNGRCGTW